MASSSCRRRRRPGNGNPSRPGNGNPSRPACLIVVRPLGRGYKGRHMPERLHGSQGKGGEGVGAFPGGMGRQAKAPVGFGAFCVGAEPQLLCAHYWQLTTNICNPPPGACSSFLPAGDPAGPARRTPVVLHVSKKPVWKAMVGFDEARLLLPSPPLHPGGGRIRWQVCIFGNATGTCSEDGGD